MGLEQAVRDELGSGKTALHAAQAIVRNQETVRAVQLVAVPLTGSKEHSIIKHLERDIFTTLQGETELLEAIHSDTTEHYWCFTSKVSVSDGYQHIPLLKLRKNGEPLPTQQETVRRIVKKQHPAVRSILCEGSHHFHAYVDTLLAEQEWKSLNVKYSRFQQGVYNKYFTDSNNRKYARLRITSAPGKRPVPKVVYVFAPSAT